MHGVKRRLKTSEEVERERREKELEEIKKYRALSDEIMARKEKGELTKETLKLCDKMLIMNSEFYSVWNLRRKILIHIAEDQSDSNQMTEEDIQELYKSELKFIEGAIQSNPKSYWVWLHRVWVTNRIHDCDWARELKLCGMLLALDERNFHCWSYRRYVASKSGISLDEEFVFTTSKIEENFSNYSAWHQRSALLPKMYSGEQLRAALLDELELVQNAFYTEPNDQSAWFYHRWIIAQICGKETGEEEKNILLQELKKCKELFELEPNSKWVLLTITWLLQRLGGHEEEVVANFERLKSLDPFRKNYFGYCATHPLHLV